MIQVTSRWHGNDQEHFLYSPSNSFDEIMAEAIKRVVEKPAISLSHPINVITKHDFSDLSDLRKTVVIGYDYDVSNVDENNDIARLSVYISGPYSGEVLNFPSRFSEDIEIPIPFEAKPSRETVTDLLENHFRKHFFDICGEKL